MILSRFIKYSIPVFFTILVLVNASMAPKILAYAILGAYIFITFYILFKQPNIFLHKAFTVLILMSVATLLYWILFDRSAKGIEYFVARTITFTMIAISIYYYREFLIEHLPKIFMWTGFVILLYGLLTNHSYFGGRYSGPFNNPNSLGWFSALLFGIALLELEKSRLKIFLLLFFLGLSFASGSRASIGGVVLAFIFQGGLTPKKIFLLSAGVGALLLMQQVASSFGFHSGLERLISAETSKEGLLSGRAMEWKLAFETFLEKPLTGHGLINYAYISDSVLIRHGVFRIDAMFAANPHNSFLAVITQYGAIFSTFILGMLIYYLIKIYKTGCPKKSLYFITLYSFVASAVEAYLFSVSGFEGFVFWSTLPLCLMAIQEYRLKLEKTDQKVL